MKGFLDRIWRLPTVVRHGLLYADAVRHVRARRFEEAKSQLIHIREHSPRTMGNPGLATLLLALVFLEIGDFSSAADTAVEGMNQVQRLKFLRPMEQAYLSYAGKLIYEGATRAAGESKRLQLAFELADLDLQHVRPEIRDVLLLAQLVTGPPVH